MSSTGSGSEPGEVIERILGLSPHPEGGAYVETWRDTPVDGSRGRTSAILFLLRSGEASAWHRIDGTEVWHFHAGAPLELRIAPPGSPPEARFLGTALELGERPQHLVPAGAWQTARTLGAWSLVGCTVTPAFTFAGFELARPDVVEGLEAQAATTAPTRGRPHGPPVPHG